MQGGMSLQPSSWAAEADTRLHLGIDGDDDSDYYTLVRLTLIIDCL